MHTAACKPDQTKVDFTTSTLLLMYFEITAVLLLSI